MKEYPHKKPLNRLNTWQLMTKFLPPPDRETFEKEIDDLFDKIHGSKDKFARFLDVNPATISKRLNPYNEDHVSSFYQILRDIAALRLVDINLAKAVWIKVRTEVEKLLFDEIIAGVNINSSITQIHDKLGELCKAKMDGEPLNILISKSADVESEARETKDRFIAMRNERYYGLENK